jgi:hypothetical protein
VEVSGVEILWGLIVPAVALAGVFLTEGMLDRSGDRLRRRAEAGRAVVLPARLGRRPHRWLPRGALVRDGDHLLWLPRRPLSRRVLLRSDVVAERGRFVDESGSGALARHYRDYGLHVQGGGMLRIPEWCVGALDALRAATPVRTGWWTKLVGLVPRWTLLVPGAVLLAFSPLVLAWSNGKEVAARVTGHDLEYDMCHITWTTPSGTGSATIDCHMEPVGGTLPARALGFPFPGEAADLAHTWQTVIGVTVVTVAFGLLVLTAHVTLALARRPVALVPSTAPQMVTDRAAGGLGSVAGHASTVDTAVTGWQRRAVEWAALGGAPGPARREMPAWTRGPSVWRRTVVAAAGGWLVATGVLGLAGGMAAGFSGADLWQLQRSERTTVTVEVVEAGRLEPPFPTRLSTVRTEDGSIRELSTWAALEEGEQLRVEKAGEVLALPGDSGHELELGLGLVLLTLACGCLLVAVRKIRTATGSASKDPTGGLVDVPYAAFRMPDGVMLLVLLESDGRAALAVPLRDEVPTTGHATVPRGRAEGHVFAPVVDGTPRAPVAAAETVTDRDLEELLAEID